MTTEFVSLLVDLLFQTLSIYDGRASRKAVDDVIIKVLTEAAFIKSFAATLVQAMERNSKFQSGTGGYRLLKWSCFLLIYSQFALLSKNALCRVAQAQASLLHIVMQGSFRLRRACRKTFFHLFTKVHLPFHEWFLFDIFSEVHFIYLLSYIICCSVTRYIQNIHGGIERWKDFI